MKTKMAKKKKKKMKNNVFEYTFFSQLFWCRKQRLQFFYNSNNRYLWFSVLLNDSEVLKIIIYLTTYVCMYVSLQRCRMHWFFCLGGSHPAEEKLLSFNLTYNVNRWVVIFPIFFRMKVYHLKLMTGVYWQALNRIYSNKGICS